MRPKVDTLDFHKIALRRYLALNDLRPIAGHHTRGFTASKISNISRAAMIYYVVDCQGLEPWVCRL